MKALQIRDFGTVKNEEMGRLFIMENEAGTKAAVTDFGAALVNLLVKDKDGILTDVVLGYDEAADYEAGTQSLGATVGRNANRIGGAAFEINGTRYELDKNDNEKNNLHSGMDFYNHRMWEAEEQEDGKITFLLESPDGDQGYPGNVAVRVTYELTEDNELRITYDGTPDQDTILNLTNHSYFNLNGHDSGDVLGHTVVLDADFYTRADAESIPTGELVDVTGTPMDFRTPHLVGTRIDEPTDQLTWARGYDHTYILNKAEGELGFCARLQSPKTGIIMETYTTQPGVQLYTGNWMTGNFEGKNGGRYPARAALCLETQHFPDSPNRPEYPSTVLRPGEVFESKTIYKFSAE